MKRGNGLKRRPLPPSAAAKVMWADQNREKSPSSVGGYWLRKFLISVRRKRNGKIEW
jgi:hypothetical protein